MLSRLVKLFKPRRKASIIDIINNLPADIVEIIIASYCPEIIFLYKYFKHDWDRQYKLSFGIAPIGDARHDYHVRCLRRVYSETNSISKRLNNGIIAIKSASSSHHNIYLASDGKLFAEGFNWAGQTGTNAGLDIQLTRIEYCIRSYCQTPLPGDIIQIGCGTVYSVIMTSDGRIMVSGYVDGYKVYFTELPQTDIIHIVCNKTYFAMIFANGDLQILGEFFNNYLNKSYKYTHEQSRVIQVACGINHVLVLLSDNTLMSMGSNKYQKAGQHKDTTVLTEIQKRPKNIQKIACRNQASFIKTKRGKVYCSGLYSETLYKPFTQVTDLAIINDIFI